MVSNPAHPSSSIAVLLADVDGTLVTKEKVITDRAAQAVKRMREAGIIFTITSGRPPRGMRMLVEPLGLTMPMAAFNGGVILLPDLSVLDERQVPEYLLPAIVGTWLVFMGSLYASGRRWVIGLAVAAGALFALEVALLVLLIWMSQGFGGRTDHTSVYEFLLLLTLAAGPTMIWWFTRSQLRAGASPETGRGRHRS